MPKKLQVTFEVDELADIQKVARRRGLTVAAWVREALRAAREADARDDAAVKLRAVQEAVGHSYPIGAIDQILGDIERGYLARPEA